MECIESHANSVFLQAFKTKFLNELKLLLSQFVLSEFCDSSSIPVAERRYVMMWILMEAAQRNETFSNYCVSTPVFTKLMRKLSLYFCSHYSMVPTKSNLPVL